MYLLHGYLGYGNYGDELLARLVEQKLKEIEYQPKIARLSSRNGFFDHINAIAACKEMISIGGLFQDKTSKRSPFYYFLNILAAKLMGKKVKILAQGIGPLHSKRSKFFTWLSYVLADKVSVRDKNSKMILDEWGIDHYYGSDLAWLLADNHALEKSLSPERIAYIQKIFFNVPIHKSAIMINNFGMPAEEGHQIDRANEPMMVISLRSENQDFSGQLASRIVDKIAKEFDINSNTPLLVLQMQDCDRKVHDLFYRYTKKIYFLEAKYFSPEEIIYALRTYGKQIVGMRFHALVFAKIAGLDITAIASDPKIREFTHQVDVYTCDVLRDRAEKHYEKVLEQI